MTNSSAHNPFITRGMIRDPRQFFGRRAELDRLLDRLQTMQSVTIVGERCIGKSSLLFRLSQLNDQLRQPTRVVYTPLADVKDEPSFYACLSLVDLKNEQRSRQATIEDVQKSLALALENGDYAFQGVWEWIPAKERPLLGWLASNEPAPVEEMAQRLSKSEAEVRGMAERLTEAEVLGREGDETQYRFQVPLLRQWVARYAVLKGMDFGKRQAAD